MRLTRKAREQHRHSRAVVLQELATPPLSAIRQDIAKEQRKAEKLRLAARARASDNT
jgi:hypothetical protein